MTTTWRFASSRAPNSEVSLRLPRRRLSVAERRHCRPPARVRLPRDTSHTPPHLVQQEQLVPPRVDQRREAVPRAREGCRGRRRAPNQKRAPRAAPRAAGGGAARRGCHGARMSPVTPQHPSPAEVAAPRRRRGAAKRERAEKTKEPLRTNTPARGAGSLAAAQACQSAHPPSEERQNPRAGAAPPPHERARAQQCAGVRGTDTDRVSADERARGID